LDASWVGFAVGLVVAGVAACTDLRTGLVPNRLTVPAGVAAVAYAMAVGAVRGWWFTGWALLDGLVTFLVALALHLLGVMGGGDVKLLPSLAVFVHRGRSPWWGLDVTVNSILAYAPFGLCYLSAWAFRLHGRRFPLEVGRRACELLLLYAVAGPVSLVLPSWRAALVELPLVLGLWVVVRRWGLGRWVVLGPVLAGAYAVIVGPWTVVWWVALALALGWVFAAARLAAVEKRVEELREGEIPVEVVVRKGERVRRVGRLRAVVLLATGRAVPEVVPSGEGLSREDIERLKRLGVERLRVGHATPFAPAILIGYVLTFWCGGCALRCWG
jgi:prepilin signal peptidase PulO-like enzyme (type II secretory pathway)